MTLRKSALWITVMAVMMEMMACVGVEKRDNSVPRRTAYPRVELYDTVYRAVPDLPVNLQVNSGATVSVDRRSENVSWINVAYPRYGAIMRFTLSRLSGKELSEAVANRMERASLNVGGLSTEVTELVSESGIPVTLMLTPSAQVTPVQVIAYDGHSFLLSGTVQFSSPDVEANAPAVKAIHADMLYLAKHLSLQ